MDAKDWTKELIPELKAELKLRKLSQHGARPMLINRLTLTDGFPKTPRGRRAKYESDLEKLKQRARAKIAPFPHFPELPAEIRDYIWDLSLPGPRVLVSQKHFQSEDKLHFPKTLRAPNPVALMVCRESRAVALSLYKLCFGTHDIYADLPGGDILYFASTQDTETLDDIWSWTVREAKERKGRIVVGEPVCKALSISVWKDLEAVKHVALGHVLWSRYDESQYIQDAGRNGVLLRKHLAKFKSLERVSLNMNHKADPVLYGHLQIGDPFFEKPPFDHGIPPDSESSSCGLRHNMTYQEWKRGRKEILGNYRAVRVLRQFDLSDLTPAEIENGLPQVRLVDIKKVLDVPHRVIEKRYNFV
jgi:hypothetical protein